MASRRQPTLESLGWRARPGILGSYPASPESVHALLGYYLQDRHSPSLYPGRDMLLDGTLFDWGVAPPLEKVISGPHELALLLGMPEVYRQAVHVVEPWQNVGINLQGEAVRASKNIAYILQQIADADTVLYPLWQSGVFNAQRMAHATSAGIATIVQGGNPSAHDPGSFAGSAASLEDILSFTDELLLRRSTDSGPSIFICLGHQLAAVSQVRLLQRAVREICDLAYLPMDPNGQALASLRHTAAKIAKVGSELPVLKNGEVIARGWDDRRFAVARNEEVEVGTRRLLPYQPTSAAHLPPELRDSHALIADELDGVIDSMLYSESTLDIEMFHSDEVNEEAALFNNWAFNQLHNTMAPLRYQLAVSPLAWLLSLPYAVEILSRTQVNDSHWTEVSTTCIYYRDWETQTIRRSFTCQFHPELMADIRDIGKREGPRYKELKDNDGARLLIRLLYHGMQE